MNYTAAVNFSDIYYNRILIQKISYRDMMLKILKIKNDKWRFFLTFNQDLGKDQCEKEKEIDEKK